MLTVDVPDLAIKFRETWYAPQDGRVCISCRDRDSSCIWPVAGSSRKLKACHACAMARVRCDEQDRPPKKRRSKGRGHATNPIELDEDSEEVCGGTEEEGSTEMEQSWLEVEEAESPGTVEEQVRYPRVEEFEDMVDEITCALIEATKVMSAASDEVEQTCAAMRKLTTVISAERDSGFALFLPESTSPDPLEDSSFSSDV